VLAVDSALPYGFVAMLFGETMSAVEGIGFSMVQLRHIGAPLAEGIALACVLLAIWIMSSCTLRFAARWCCGAMATDPVTQPGNKYENTTGVTQRLSTT